VEPIAVIGMGCRFPQAANPKAFWRLLVNGVDAITEIPSTRWDLEQFYDSNPEAPGKTNSRWGGFLEEIDRFDADFFRIPPKEAMQLDPQQRLLLEVAWEALEDAGQAPDRLAGTRTGVFVGVMNTEFAHIWLRESHLISPQLGAGSSSGITANRLSYFLNFHGPSMVIDTLCSSSLVAVHQACRSIWNGESDPVAIAGGVNLILLPAMNIYYAKAGLAAPDGRCKTFDARANGIVRGEGAGLVVLKTLRRAQQDGDRVYCIIRGSAVNHDGRTNGLTAPNRWAQIAVLEEAYRQAGVSPGRVEYVEAHGTGTPLGDSIEATALGTALAAGRCKEDRCSIGSVKTNIGHLESGAGIASLIKTALMLKHRTLAPSLHFQTPNPYIPFDELQLRVQRTAEPWVFRESSAVAGVSSFGLGGANAHVVLESVEPPAEIGAGPEQAAGEAYILPISARSANGLRAAAESYRDFILEESQNQAGLRDPCYTAGVRRSHHDLRLAILARSRSELKTRLDALTGEKSWTEFLQGHRTTGRGQKLAFVFAGQGTQWAGMGSELLETEPVFRAAVERCDALLGRYAKWSLIDELRADRSRSRLFDTEIAQPAIFALQVGLVALWESWGIKPQAVVGHSAGEVAAAYVAGILSLEDALKVIFHRGRLMQRATGKGKMMAVKMPRERLEQVLAMDGPRLSLSALNSPNSFTISGDPEIIEERLASLSQEGIAARLLPGDYAFHSQQMESLQEELADALQDLRPRPSELQIFSTLTGQSAGEREYDRLYWARQIREPVLFDQAVNRLISGGFRLFVEIGPHPALAGSIAQSLRHHEYQGLALSSLKRESRERETMLDSLSVLYAQGAEVEWEALYPEPGRCLSLPQYPWQKERLCMEDRLKAAPAPSDARRREFNGSGHPALGKPLYSAGRRGDCLWQGEAGIAQFPYLNEHRLRGEVLMPASAYLEMALSAALEVFKGSQPILKNVRFLRPLKLKEGEDYSIQLIVSQEASAQARFQVFSSPAAEPPGEREWTLHVQGTIHPEPESGATRFEPLRLDEIERRCQQSIDTTEFYRDLKQGGIEYGENFQGVFGLKRRDGEALAQLRISESLRTEAADYVIHPALLDSAFHPLLSTLPEDGTDLYWPVALESLQYFAPPTGDLEVHAALHDAPQPGAEVMTGDLTICDQHGRRLLEAHGLKGRRLTPAGGALAEEQIRRWLHQPAWQRQTEHEVVSVQNPAPPERAGGWWIFSDQKGLGQELHDLLRRRGESSILVFHGDSYQRLGEDRYLINCSRPEDFQRLFSEAPDSVRQSFSQVVHLWSLDGAPAEEATLSTLEEAQRLGCISVVHLIKALDRAGWTHPPRLWLVTSRAQMILPGDDMAGIAQAPLWGLGRTMSQELPQFRCAMIDVGGDDWTLDAAAIFQEISSNPDDHPQIAWRDGRRYLLQLSGSSPEVAGAERPDGFKRRDAGRVGDLFRENGVYLITGGLGALGLQVAQWMAENGARHLVLIGRHGPSDGARQALTKLEQAGTRIDVKLADIASQEQLAEVLADIRRESAELRGIVHLAGILADGILLTANAERFEEVMRPKILGTWNLHRQVVDLPLDFFVMFSSLASVLNSKGQGNYAAANAFLDALAHYRNGLGSPALSINWGPWSEAGMAAGLDERMALAGLRSLTPQQGLNVLELLLHLELTQVAIIPGTGQPGSELPATVAAEETELSNQPNFKRRLEESPADERWPLLIAHLRAEVGAVLGYNGHKQVEIDRDFFEMGMDSLMVVELGRNLQKSLEQNFPISMVFEHPSIEDFAGVFSQEILSPEIVVRKSL